jgi:hypothetical protein
LLQVPLALPEGGAYPPSPGGDESLLASARVRLGTRVEREPRRQYFNLREP